MATTLPQQAWHKVPASAQLLLTNQGCIVLHFHLKACSKCHGDLVLDEGDWLCLQCGTYFYTRLYRTPAPLSGQSTGTESRIGDGSEDRSKDRRVKAVSAIASAVPGLSRFPVPPAMASGFGETAAFEPGVIEPGALAFASGFETRLRNGFDHR